MTDSRLPGSRFIHGSSDTLLDAFVSGLEDIGITHLRVPEATYTVLSREPLVIQIPIRFDDFTVGEVPWHDALDATEYPTEASAKELTEQYFVQDLTFARSSKVNRWSYTDAYYTATATRRLTTFKYEGEIYLAIGEEFERPVLPDLVTI